VPVRIYATLKRKGDMAAQNSIHVSDELLAELQAKAAAEGKTVDELAEQALRKGLEDRAWQDLLEYGRENGQRSGYKESDVPDLVREWRREQGRR
jgi:predicted transcriptional regulator